jgi:hypothetical protein
MDEATMARRPNDHCNSIGWLLWHMNRVWDGLIHDWLTETTQIWVSQGWHQQYGMSDDPTERGLGWTAEQVGAWQPPSREVQLGYYEAIKTDIREYLASMTLEGLERLVVVPPRTDTQTVGTAMGQRTWDNITHGG